MAKQCAWWFGNGLELVGKVVKECSQCQLHNKTNPTKVIPPMTHVGFKKEFLGLVAMDLKKLPTCPETTCPKDDMPQDEMPQDNMPHETTCPIRRHAP